MKNRFLLLMALVLLASCVVLKKRYMNGCRIFTWHKKENMVMNNSRYRKNLNVSENVNPDGYYATASMLQEGELSCNHANSLTFTNSSKQTINEVKVIDKGYHNDKRKLTPFQHKKRKQNIEKKNLPSVDDDPWEITGKSKNLAILLCILLGLFGVHRFYLGYTGMGCLYALTGGLFFVGCGIDLVRLLNDDLKPKISESQKKYIEENRANPNLSGSPVSLNIVAEPHVVIKDARNGILELNLIYKSKLYDKGILRIDIMSYYKDEKNDPYYQRMPAYDSVKTHNMLMERCKSLGFKNYKKFEGYRKECHELVAPESGACKMYKVIMECQCTN